jgi:hypothetical protein
VKNPFCKQNDARGLKHNQNDRGGIDETAQQLRRFFKYLFIHARFPEAIFDVKVKVTLL